MKQWDSTFNNNHLRLMRVHIGFACFYGLLAIISVFFLYKLSHVTIQLLIITFVFSLSPIVLHVFLAVGAKNKLEISRKISEIVFAFLFLAFPIGTILSMLYFLPKTIWKESNDDKK